MAVLNKGARNVEILKQGQYAPVPVENQVAIIYCGTAGLLKDVPVAKVKEFEADFIEYMNLQYKDTLEEIRKGNIDKSVTDILEKAAAETVLKFTEKAKEHHTHSEGCGCEI
jgi:F-type H+-transporting ATPase subunit alpha